MLNITDKMIKEWNMDISTGDWMGYYLKEKEKYTFHHLIVPKSEKGPKAVWNGAILCRNSSHPYLHLIERFDRDVFDYLTNILININMNHCLPDEKMLKLINDALISFEKEYCSTTNCKNEYIIREEYTRRKVKKNILISYKN